MCVCVLRQCRRSMRFSVLLREIGDRFRRMYLGSTDEDDSTVLEPDWRSMKVSVQVCAVRVRWVTGLEGCTWGPLMKMTALCWSQTGAV